MPPRANRDAPFWVMLRASTAKILSGALAQTRGSVIDAAELLGINYKTFLTYAREAGVEVKTRKWRSSRRRNTAWVSSSTES